MKAVIYARCNSKVIYSLDRFAKNRYESAEYKYKLKRNGVSIFSTKENITDDASGILLKSFLEGIIEYQALERSRKIKESIARRKRKKKE